MWSFRVTFNAPRHISIDTEKMQLDLGEGIKLLALPEFGTTHDRTNPSLRQEARLSITGSGYETEDSAKSAAENAVWAVLIASMRSRIGVSFDVDMYTAALTNKLREKLPLTMHMDDELGLHVQNDNSRAYRPAIARVPGNFKVEDFSLNFASEFNSRQDQYDLAGPLLVINLALSESLAANRFLLAITAIESIAGKRSKIDEDEVAVINALLKHLRSLRISGEKRQAISSRIGELKYQAIGKWCQKLIERDLGKDKALLFQDLYARRSKLVHEGTRYDSFNLYKWSESALSLATELIEIRLTDRR